VNNKSGDKLVFRLEIRDFEVLSFQSVVFESTVRMGHYSEGKKEKCSETAGRDPADGVKAIGSFGYPTSLTAWW